MDARTIPKKPKPPRGVDAAPREWEMRFRSLIELSSEWYWEQDEDCRFTLVTGSTLGHGGIGPEKFVGTFRWDRGAVPVGDGGSWDPHKSVLKARQPFSDFLFKRTGSEGDVLTISTSGQPVFDEKGRFCGYRGIARDVTRGRRAEQLLALEHAVSQRLAEAEGAAATLKAVIRAVCETEGWDCGRYFRLDEKAAVLRFAEGWSVPGDATERFIAESRQLTYARGAGLAGLVWQTELPVWSSDIANDPRVAQVKLARETGMHGAFLFPVMSEGKVIGVFTFNSRQVREPEERLLQAIRVIGSQIGQFLQRKQAEEEQLRFRAAMDASADMITLVDRETLRYVDVNLSACRMHGYSREEMLQMGPADFSSLSKEQLERSYDETIASGTTTRIESYQNRKDGTRVPTEVLRRAVRSGERWIVVAIVRDISERRRAEELQALEHAVTRALAEADGVAGALKAVMRVVCETLGWECGRYFRKDDAAGVFRFAESWYIPNPELDGFIQYSADRTFAPGVGIVGKAGAGEPQWVANLAQDPRVVYQSMASDHGMRGAFMFPVMSEGNALGVLSFTSREIREPDERLQQAARAIGAQIGQFLQRKKAEVVLRESEERFRALTGLSSDMYWTQDSEHRFTTFSGSNKTLPLRLIGKRRWDEESFNMTETDWAAHKATMDARQPFRDLELGRRSETGETFWVSVSGAPVFDDSGNFTGYRGLSKNITARKRAEQLRLLEHAVSRSLAEADSAQAGLRAAIRAVCETESWDCGRYFRVDEKAEVLRFADAWSVPDPAVERFIETSRELTYRPGVGLSGQVWRSGQPLWSNDVGSDPRASGWSKTSPSREIGLHGTFVFPVVSDGKTIGVLSFASRKAREPEERLLEAIRVIGSQIGQFVKRKQAEDVVRENEERFRSLTVLSSDMYWEQDEQFRFTSMSGTGSDRVNPRSFPSIGKKRWEQNYVNMTADQWAEHIAAIEAHKPFRDMELCRLDESGKKLWISVSGEPVFDSSGAFRGYRGVGKDISERKQDEERIQFLANHDALTSLPNRAMFSEVLNLAIQNARRYNRNFAVLFIDLDRFKNINDTLGHDAGDKLLQEMGTRLTQTVRSSDVVARLGGDEFVVLVQEVAEPKQAAAVARKILSALVQPMSIQGQECRLTASIGICMYPSEAQNEQALMKNADIAMYRAKEDGKNNYKFYSEEINIHSFERMALETSLRRGLERNEFFLHYQAKLDLHTKRITGVEALIRWQHPDLGMVAPVQFIPLAEETGLIVPIGKWVLNTACAQNVAWQREGLPPLSMAVNLSARQFADEDLVKDIAEALENSGMKPELLEIELTESMVIQNPERAGKVLAEIKKMGARLAIDDFGVGYSSLTHLKRFPIDTLKVDRSFIRDLPQDPEDRAICEAIIAMGKSLKLTVVAEGVETLEQQTFLRDHNCDEMQGFFFSKPIASDQFAALLRERIQSSKQ